MSITSFDPSSFDMWDPFNGFSFNRSLLSSLDPTFSLSFPSDNSGFTMASMDWKETLEAHVLKVDLPGMKKEEVKVEVEGRVLQISGERAGEKEEKDVDTWHLVERSSGKFMRGFRLPENAKIDQIKAAMENGVLTVTVPKGESKKPEARSIEIESVKKENPGWLKMPRWIKSKKPEKTEH
jgi:HSP20 family protein